MAIIDYWGNSLDNNKGVAIGYRGIFDEFPHELYSFLLSTVRAADQSESALLYRWMIPMQQHWESQYANILALPNLYSPELCPTSLLEYLRKNVGIMDDLAYLWGVLNENEKRRLIKFFVRFSQFRTTGYGVVEMLESMTGTNVYLYGYFYYRWILSGDNATETEGAIGRENDQSDIWLLSEEDVPVAQTPTAVSILTNPSSGDDYYLIQVDSLVAAVTEPPIPPSCIVRCVLTNEVVFATIYENGGSYYVRIPDDYFFEQSPTAPSEEEDDFRVSFEPDPYVFDILIADDGDLNRDMISAIARFSRPSSERIYIRYYKLLEIFKDNVEERWNEISGDITVNEDDGYIVIGDSTTPPGSDSVYELDHNDSDEWVNYSFVIKSNSDTVDKYIEFRFMYQDSDNYYYFKATPSNPPTWPPGEWEFGRYVTSVQTVLVTGDTEWLDVDVDYAWRILCRTSTRVGGDVQQTTIYQDENELVDYFDDPLPWTSVVGTIQLVAEDGTELTVSNVRVRDYPGENEYVGP